ncbi:MAG: non-homologous end-joining DNA ligase [Acidimicrobiales bacterium]
MSPREGYEAVPLSVKPMLATLGELPLEDYGWTYELKWDGVRAIAYAGAGNLRLESRNGNDLTASFPELWAIEDALGDNAVVLDGEIVAFGSDQRPNFQLLQPRIHTADRRKAMGLAARQPATFVLFDLCYVNGKSLLDKAYEERRGRLDDLHLSIGDYWTLSPRFEGPGLDVYRASKAQGMEGVVAKRDSSPYRSGKRSADWTKVKNTSMQEVVIGGWVPGDGRRKDRIGSLLLGVPSDRGLTYVGQVGTGFTDEILSDLAGRLEPLRRDSSPFLPGVPPRYARSAHFVEPRLVGEVAFGQWTNDDRLRHPSWRGLREDKDPTEVVREP